MHTVIQYEVPLLLKAFQLEKTALWTGTFKDVHFGSDQISLKLLDGLVSNLVHAFSVCSG